MEHTNERLLKKARLLPSTPGVYQMFSAGGELLYVGKSKALKARVSSYFQNSPKNVKTARLVEQIADFTTISTQTEQEALLLENELIKLHKPKYNILLKDDKNYPYLYLSTEDAYPTLSLRRSRNKKDPGLYFGPYSSSNTVYELIKTANHLFSPVQCKKKFPQDIGKERPCLYYDMGRCVGVCRGDVSPEEYRKIVSDIILFLKHEHKHLSARLEAEMYKLSDQMNFEAAGRVRDMLFALKKLEGRQHVIAREDYNADVFALYQSDVLPLIARLCVRKGRLIDATYFPFSPRQIIDAQSFSSLLYDFYRASEDIPPRILLDEALFDPEDETLPALLSERAQRKTRLSHPQRGQGASLLQLARENAEKEALHRLSLRENDNRTLTELADLLGLSAPPNRIESYDISNNANDSIYAGMVVCIDGQFKKSLYRSFRIQQTVKDDYAGMCEVLCRRMGHVGEPGWERPDLILLDGGMMHVKVVKETLSELGYRNIPVFGMVKDEHHKTRTLQSETEELSVAKSNLIFSFLYRLQDEVHRYSLKCMDASRRKKMLSSTLTSINGIGEQKAKALLKAHRSLANIRTLSEEELAQTRGISKADARRIYEHFHKQ